MAFKIVAKNNDVVPLKLTNLLAIDRQIPVGGSAELTAYNTIFAIQADPQLATYVTNGKVTLNDGTRDLSADEAIRILTPVVSNTNIYSFNSVTEKTSPVGNDVIIVEDSENQYSKRKVKLSRIVAEGNGEVNTASNIGTSGVGVYAQKSDVDIQFKNIKAASTKVTVTDNPTPHTIDIDVVPGNIAHQDISGAGSNTHATIDSHIANVSNPHNTNASQVGLGNVTNDAQIKASDFPSSSVDNEIALFSGTGGKILKRASTSGMVKLTSGVLSSAVVGTDYEAPISSGTTEQYWRGDKTWQNLPSTIGVDTYRKVGTSLYEAWYSSSCTGASLTSSALVKNRLYALPFIVPVPVTLDRIAINVTTLYSGNARLGIYDNDNCYPTNLILDAGIVSTSTTGVKSITINTTLSTGLKWLVLVSSGTATIRCFAFGGIVPLLGFGPTLGITEQVGVYVTYSYSELPSVFPTNSPTPIIAVPIPAIFVRLSA